MDKLLIVVYRLYIATNIWHAMSRYDVQVGYDTR